MKFITGHGKVVFPGYVTKQAFQDKMMNTLLTLNGYQAELEYWKHKDQGYSALAHVNMNVDNAYFWRSDSGRLNVGVFDWGGLNSGSLGHKLWWWLYCGDYDVIAANIDGYLDCFISNYKEYGGPELHNKTLRRMFIITAMQQLNNLCNAVPQINKMCPPKEWDTIQDRYDPRVGENIDGKSTLRLYLHCMNTVIRMIEEWKADKVLEAWIEDFYVKQLGKPRKNQSD